MEKFWQDVRFGLRMLRKNPGFTAVAVLTLALGIGANTAIFSVVNAVLLQPLPYPQPERLVQLVESFPEGIGYGISVPEFMAWRSQTVVFQDIAAFEYEGPGINLTSGDRSEQLKGIHVSAGYFAVFGAPMAMGRTFTQEEDRPGGPHVAVISNGLWRSRFGGDPNLVSQTIALGGESYQVVGVLGPRFSRDPYPPVDIILPLQADPNSVNANIHLLVAARLKAGVTIAKARAAMKLAAEEFHRKFPTPGIMDTQESFTAIPLLDVLVENVRPALLILLGTVGFVLLIACANMANLLQARGALRRRELAVRTVLGAARRRIISQLLTESVLLSIGGGVLGLILGYFGVRSLLAMNPGDIPRIGEHGSAVTLDWRVLAFTLLVSVLTAILFGVMPTFGASRFDLSSALNESASRSGTSLRQNKNRAVLIITEVALAVVLLVGAGLLIHTFAALRNVNPGFDPRNVLTMQMSLNEPRFEWTSGVAQLAREAEQRIRGIPGVEAAALTAGLPFGMGFNLPFRINAHPPTDGPYNGDVFWHDVSPGYFQTLRIPLLRGRLFTNQDDSGAVGVVLISEAMAKQFWPQGNPLGDLIRIGDIGTDYEDSPRQIIGVVANIRERLNWELTPAVYVPIAQTRDGLTSFLIRTYPMKWVVRTRAAATYSLSTDIQQELRAASGGLPAVNIRSMEQVVWESTGRDEFNMTLLSIFAGVALLLAVIGVYGLMAYSVQQRTHEIGIRVALGAQRGDVLRVVLRDGLLLCLIGIVIGIFGAFGMTRLLKSLIFEISPTDPLTFVSVAVLFAGVAFVACWIPARGAARVDPMVALRYE